MTRARRTLLVAGLGIALDELVYEVPAIPGLRPFGPLEKSAIQARHGLAALVRARARHEVDDLDLVLLTTPQTPMNPPAWLAGRAGLVRTLPDVVLEDIGVPRDRSRILAVDPDVSDWERALIAEVAALVGLTTTSRSPLAALSDYGCVVIEVGAGLRHVALGLYLTSLYLRARVGRDRVAVFYAEKATSRQPLVFHDDEIKQVNPPGAMPPLARPSGSKGGRLIGLDGHFDLVEAAVAAHALARHGDLRGLAALLRARGGGLPDDVTGFLDSAQAGLDLEASICAGRLVDPGTPDDPLLGLALETVRQEAEQWALRFPSPPSDLTRAKEQIILDEVELKRQAGIVSWMVERGRFVEAALLAREWVVSAVLLASGRADQWLDRQAREGTHRLSRHRLDRTASKDVCDLKARWRQIVTDRNPLAHAARTPQWVRAEPERRFPGAWRRLRDTKLETYRQLYEACREA